MSPTATSTAAAVPSNSSQVEGGLTDGPPVMSIVAALSSEKWPGRRKVFVCPHEGCDKAYAVKNYLVEHERLQTGAKPLFFASGRFPSLPSELSTVIVAGFEPGISASVVWSATNEPPHLHEPPHIILSDILRLVLLQIVLLTCLDASPLFK